MSRLKLLWHFSTGDRADGGLKDVCADTGHLIVELHSQEGSNGLCCTTRFVRTRYKWEGDKFQQINVEMLPIANP